MAKKIEVTPDVRERLKEEHCVGNDQTVYNALNYVTDSPLAKMIRRRALELGGVEWATREEWHRDLFCDGCAQAYSPACDKMVPCCRCSEKNCNSRQVCAKRSTKDEGGAE